MSLFSDQQSSMAEGKVSCSKSQTCEIDKCVGVQCMHLPVGTWVFIEVQARKHQASLLLLDIMSLFAECSSLLESSGCWRNPPVANQWKGHQAVLLCAQEGGEVNTDTERLRHLQFVARITLVITVSFLSCVFVHRLSLSL